MQQALLQQARVPGKLGHYRIDDKIGAGGMGEVFRAHDEHLDREVAIKILPPGVLQNSAARHNFRREAMALSKLNHPSVATIFDFDTQDDIDFLVMEYIPGVTLSDRLLCGPIPGTLALELGVQLAAGLVAAHEHGVIHRDLTSKNLRITPDGRLKILDFGLARLLAPVDVASEPTMSSTEACEIAGTLDYMAPEQLRGEPLDARSDLWAAGVVLFEMVTGRLPFHDKAFSVTIDAILHQPAPNPASIVHDLPACLETAILRCLEKSPGDRMQTAAELAIVFREPGEKRSTVPINPPVQSIYKPNRRKVGYLAALAVIFLVTSLNIGKPLGGSPAPLPVMKHLAVLPFVAVDPDTNARAFSQGLSEALTAKLTQLTTKHPLQVVPASEIRAQSISSVEQAHTILGVNLVFEGSFRLSGPLIRVTYDLVDARSRRVLRADAITADANDPFLLEDQVVDSALRSLDLELTWQERHRIASRGTTEPAAYDLYLRGRGYLLDYQDPENTKKAIAAFTEALQRDPQYAPAFAGLGEGYWQKFEQTHDSTWVQQAEEACRHANASSVGHGCLGTVFNGTGSYEQAAQEFERELKIDPTSDSAYRGLAYAYEKLGKADDAERTYLSAIKARPRYWAGYSWLGVFLVDQGRYAESLEMFAKVNELAPDNIRGYNNRGGIYVLTGRFAEAETVLKKSLNIRPTADAYLNLGTADFYLHKFEDAASAYEQALKLDSQNRTAWGNLADAYYWIPAKRKDALDAYRKATTLGEEQVRVNPNNAVLRSYLAVYYAMLNERRSANMHLAKALASHDHAPDIFLNSAIIYNQFGNSADAILSLKKGLQLGLLPVVASNHPSLDNLKSDPAVKALFDTSKVQ